MDEDAHVKLRVVEDRRVRLTTFETELGEAIDVLSFPAACCVLSAVPAFKLKAAVVRHVELFRKSNIYLAFGLTVVVGAGYVYDLHFEWGSAF